MIWLMVIWAASIILNTVTIVRSMMTDKSRVTPLYLFYYITFGTIGAPMLALMISIGIAISIHQKLKKVGVLNKTIYRFGGNKDE